MIHPSSKKDKAIELRRLGFSHLEISKELHVAKSTLSSWLKNLKIPEKAEKKLLLKTTNAHILGSIASRKKTTE